jgi:hypothetical protein
MSNPKARPAKSAADPSAAAPKALVKSGPVPYVDDERDYRDVVLLGAIKGAIQLIEDAEAPDLACEVLRLVRDRLEASWPTSPDVKFTAEVAHV